MWYNFVRKILFSLDAEFSHDLTLNFLRILSQSGFFNKKQKNQFDHRLTCFGLNFPNPVGLAAGLDKNGECLSAWRAMGFGFIEVGTLTPKPQPGNARPRLFRIPQYQAIINRMGFNSKGADYLVSQVQKFSLDCPLGINIGKNRDTPLNQAVEDYLFCFRKVYEFADYITLNISSPNTPGLRDLQQSELLKNILIPLKSEQDRFSQLTGKKVPLLVKISPDLNEEQLKEMVGCFIQLQIEGVIATNTTIARSGIIGNMAKEEGGLSGAPLFQRSTQIVRKIYAEAGDVLPIIAVGGIMDAKDAKEKFASGAKLIQLYTGLIYKGPGLVKEILLENSESRV